MSPGCEIFFEPRLIDRKLCATGKLTDSSCNPVAGATVTLSGSKGALATTVTKTDGSFSFNGIEIGDTTKVTVSGSGCRKAFTVQPSGLNIRQVGGSLFVSNTSGKQQSLVEVLERARKMGVTEVNISGNAPFGIKGLPAGVTVNGGGQAVLRCSTGPNSVTCGNTILGGSGKAILKGVKIDMKLEVTVEAGQNLQMVDVEAPRLLRFLGAGQQTINGGVIGDLELFESSQLKMIASELKGKLTVGDGVNPAVATLVGVVRQPVADPNDIIAVQANGTIFRDSASGKAANDTNAGTVTPAGNAGAF